MASSLRWSWLHFGLAVALFATELCIARYAHDRIIRPFVGDVLVIPFMYCALATVLRLRSSTLAAGVLIFACGVEVLQYFDYVALMHLEHHRIVAVILGRTFEWSDLMAYVTGYAIVRGTEGERERDHDESQARVRLGVCQLRTSCRSRRRWS